MIFVGGLVGLVCVALQLVLLHHTALVTAPSAQPPLRMGDQAKLLSISGQLKELFSSSLSSLDRQQLAHTLSEQSINVENCLYFLANSYNDHSVCFTLTTLEHMTLAATAEAKVELYQQLTTFLDLHHATLPVVIRDKLVKLILDIARSNWSRYSQQIFTWILSLVSPASLASRPASLQLGLVLLLAAAPPQDLAGVEITELCQKMVTLLELCQQKIVASEDSSSPALDPSASGDSSHTTNPSLDQTGSSALAPVIDPAVREDGSSATTGPTPSLDPVASVDTGSSAPDPVIDPAAREDGSITSTKVAELVLRCLRHIFTWSSISPSLCGSSALINVLFQYSAVEAKSWVSFSAPIIINIMIKSIV